MVLELSIFQKYHDTYLQNTRIQCNDVQYFCIGLIDFVLNNKRLTDFSNIFSPNSFEKNDKIIFENFQ